MMEGKVEEFKTKPFFSLMKIELDFGNRYSDLMKDYSDNESLIKIINKFHDEQLKRINMLNKALQSFSGLEKVDKEDIDNEESDS